MKWMKEMKRETGWGNYSIAGNINHTVEVGMRDERVDSLFKRVREAEEALKKNKVRLTRIQVFEAVADHVSSVLTSLAVRIYKDIQPYFMNQHLYKATDFYKHLNSPLTLNSTNTGEGQELLQDYMQHSRRLMLRFPTFDGQRYNREKMYTIVCDFTPLITSDIVRELRFNARKTKEWFAIGDQYEEDAFTHIVIATDAVELSREPQQQSQLSQSNNANHDANMNLNQRLTQPKSRGMSPSDYPRKTQPDYLRVFLKKLLRGDCRSTIIIISRNPGDASRRILDIIAKFIASKLAGIYHYNNGNKLAMKTYFLKNVSLLLYNLIKEDKLELPNPVTFTSIGIKKLTARLLGILNYMIQGCKEGIDEALKFDFNKLEENTKKTKDFADKYKQRVNFFANTTYYVIGHKAIIDVIMRLKELKYGDYWERHPPPQVLNNTWA